MADARPDTKRKAYCFKCKTSTIHYRVDYGHYVVDRCENIDVCKAPR